MTRRSVEQTGDQPGPPVVLRRFRPRRLRLRLEPTATAASLARRLVDRACTEWGLSALRDPARLIITELVTNAVRHGDPPLAVTVAPADDGMHINVRDGSRTPPVPVGPVAPTVEGGRGLLVVAVLSKAWGIVPTPNGKVVWATVTA